MGICFVSSVEEKYRDISNYIGKKYNHIQEIKVCVSYLEVLSSCLLPHFLCDQAPCWYKEVLLLIHPCINCIFKGKMYVKLKTKTKVLKT